MICPVGVTKCAGSYLECGAWRSRFWIGWLRAERIDATLVVTYGERTLLTGDDRGASGSINVVATKSGLNAVRWAQEMVGNPRTVFIDTETTGLDGSAEIVDIAVVGVYGQVLLNTLVHPKRPIPFGASNIHGIFDRDVADAPLWDAVYPLLAALLIDRPVVIYNVEYDRKIIHQCCQELGLEPIQHAQTWQCAMLAHAEFIGEPGKWGRRYRWHKLEKAAAGFGIAPGGHRALSDAEACRQVVLRMAES